MQINFWTKKTDFKLFGKTIFSKVEVCNETERDSDYTIIVTEDYFKEEFDFEEKHYVVGAVIQDDTILDEGRYIYESVIAGDDFTVEKIKREFDYNRIAKAYMEMEE